jgi:putative SOS response-associated peptidase YedK
MCGRFSAQLPPELLAHLFRTRNPLVNAPPSWNVAPTDPAMAVRHHEPSGERRLDVLRWGLVPHFTKDLKTARRPINARAENVADSGMFRGALAQRRCLVPASAFYEWKAVASGKQPYAIARVDGAPLALAGIWEGWRDPAGEVLRSFAIITTSANADMAWLHERMPVVVEKADWPLWLGESQGDYAALMRPSDVGVLRLWKVRRLVNSVRNNGPQLLEEALDPA